MSFASIPLRKNSKEVLFSWFNLVRAAGMNVEAFLGSAYIPETNFTIAQGQASPANVTGLLLDSTSAKSAIVQATVRRKTNSEERVSLGFLKVSYSVTSSSWAGRLIDELSGDEDGVEFSITAGGQVQYTSDTVSGSSYSGTMSFKVMTMGN